MVVFIIALESEAAPIVQNFKTAKKFSIHERTIYFGKLCKRETAAIVCGVGKVNAAAATQYAIDALMADKIVNVGVAGGLNDGLEVAKIYGIEAVAQYDFDLVQLNHTPKGTLNEYDEPYLTVNTPPLYPLKKLGTGDRFNDDKADYLFLTEELKADIRDMEFGAIAHVCKHADINCYSFKAISDLAGSGSTTEQFTDNMEKCKNSIYVSCKDIFEAILED